MVEEQEIDPAAKPVRRTYTAQYKARVLAEYEAAAHGEKSAVLRREGLYQTLVAEWARARDLALLAAGYETGWWDEHGRPAPWPEDFFDDDSDWHPTGSQDPITPEPGQQPF